MLLTGRTRVSSRGQIVIPQALRQAAGIAEGDVLEAAYDGQKLLLYRVPADADDAVRAEPTSPFMFAEQPARYGSGGRDARVSGGGPTVRWSTSWADRTQAAASIARLSVDFRQLDAGTLMADARQELEGRGPHQ